MVILIFCYNSYKPRDVGLGVEYAHVEYDYFHVNGLTITYDANNWGTILNKKTNTFQSKCYIGDKEYIVMFTINSSFIRDSVELNSSLYVPVAYMSHVDLNGGACEPYIPINNLCGRFQYTQAYDINGTPYYYISFECTSFELILDSDTIIGVVSNNISAIENQKNF